MNILDNRSLIAVDRSSLSPSALNRSPNRSRRQFLIAASLGVGGALLAACMPIQPVAEPRATAAPAAGTPAAAGEEAKPIIDTHIHLWKLPRTEPPMITRRLIQGLQSGCSVKSWAMLLKGPTATSVISPGFAFSCL